MVLPYTRTHTHPYTHIHSRAEAKKLCVRKHNKRVPLPPTAPPQAVASSAAARHRICPIDTQLETITANFVASTARPRPLSILGSLSYICKCGAALEKFDWKREYRENESHKLKQIVF